jgi:invasion protein IalB
MLKGLILKFGQNLPYKLAFFTLMSLLFALKLTDLTHAAENTQNLYASPWTLNCKSAQENQCVIERYVFKDQKQTQRLIGIGFSKNKSDEKYLATIISPLGVLIPSGVEVLYETGQTTKYPYIFCEMGGCVSQFQADLSWLEKLAVTRSLSLNYILPNNQKVSIQIQIENLSALLNKMNLELKNKH